MVDVNLVVGYKNNYNAELPTSDALKAHILLEVDKHGTIHVLKDILKLCPRKKFDYLLVDDVIYGLQQYYPFINLDITNNCLS